MPTKELLALVGKATPGPWRDAGAGRERHMLYADLKGVPTPVADVGWFPDIDTDSANAALIVAAVNALPALCAEVEALRKDAERLDWLESQGIAYGFEDMHEGNSWAVSGAYANVRAAIDAAKEPK